MGEERHTSGSERAIPYALNDRLKTTGSSCLNHFPPSRPLFPPLARPLSLLVALASLLTLASLLQRMVGSWEPSHEGGRGGARAAEHVADQPGEALLARSRRVPKKTRCSERAASRTTTGRNGGLKTRRSNSNPLVSLFHTAPFICTCPMCESVLCVFVCGACFADPSPHPIS